MIEEQRLGSWDAMPTPEARQAVPVELRTLVDELDAIVWQADATTLQLSFVNRSAEALLGYPLDRWLGEPGFLATCVAAEDRVSFATLVQGAVVGAARVCGEHRFVAADGSTLWFATTVRMEDERRLAGTMIDITALKRNEAERAELLVQQAVAMAQAEALREAERMHLQFMAAVSHELRTPLHHIKGYASTLLRPNVYFDSDTTHEYLSVITEESNHLERLINDLLDTAQLETGNLKLEIDSVQLDELVKDAVERWQGCGDHRFVVDIPAVVPPVPADGHRVQQVIDNLIGNVVRHTPAGSEAQLSIEVVRDEIRLSMKDNGPGISSEHLAHIFQPFYQAAPSTRRGGTGLGLFICKGIVEQHGGRMWAELVPGAGASFRLSLPRRRMNQHTGSGRRKA